MYTSYVDLVYAAFLLYNDPNRLPIIYTMYIHSVRAISATATSTWGLTAAWSSRPSLTAAI